MSRRLFIALLTVAVAGCSADPTVTAVPEPPAATLKRAPQSPWSGAVAARVGSLAGHIHAQLHPRYGPVREMPYVGRDVAALGRLQRWYRAHLGAGWQLKPLSLPPEEHGFAFVAGDRALAVGWLDQLPDGRVPVVTMRYGDAS